MGTHRQRCPPSTRAAPRCKWGTFHGTLLDEVVDSQSPPHSRGKLARVCPMSIRWPPSHPSQGVLLFFLRGWGHLGQKATPGFLPTVRDTDVKAP